MSAEQSLLLAGIGKETTYATGVVASRYLPLKSEDLQAKRSTILSDHTTGGGAKEFVGDGPVDGAGPLEVIERYDLTTDPVDLLMEMIFGMGRGHWYRTIRLTALSTVAWIPLRNGAADNVELAGQFTNAVAASATITVDLWVRRRGTPAGFTNGVWVEVQTNSSGDPSGTAHTNATSAYINPLFITADDNGEKLTCTFAVDPSLAASTIYHIVVKGDYTASATNQIQVLTEVLSAGTGGNFEIKDAAWANDATSNLVGRGLTTTFIDAYLIKDSVEGLMASVAFDKQEKVHQFVGLKATSLKLTSQPKQGVRAAYDTVLSNEESSATTSAAILAGLKNDRTKPLHTELTLLVGDQANPLVAADAMKPDSVEFSFSRPQDAVHTSGGDTIIEPLAAGRRDLMLNLVFPRYDETTWQTWHASKTALQVSLQWTAGGKYRTLLLPVCKIEGAPAVATDGSGKAYGIKVTLRCLGNRGTLANLYLPIYGEAEYNLLAA